MTPSTSLLPRSMSSSTARLRWRGNVGSQERPWIEGSVREMDGDNLVLRPGVQDAR